MAYVKQLKDADTGDAIFPVTHTSAVTDGNGSDVGQLINAKQDTLVSGTNIKTVNSNSLLGQGDVELTSRNINYRETSGRSNLYLTTGTTLTLNLEALEDAILNTMMTYRRLAATNNAVASVSLYPNNVYQLCSDRTAGTWATIKGITITLNYIDDEAQSFTTAAPHRAVFSSFRCVFKTASTINSPFMTIPSGCRYMNDETPTFETGKFYDVKIENNMVEVRHVTP